MNITANTYEKDAVKHFEVLAKLLNVYLDEEYWKDFKVLVTLIISKINKKKRILDATSIMELIKSREFKNYVNCLSKEAEIVKKLKSLNLI